METFALVKSKEGFPGRFVMPWLIGITSNVFSLIVLKTWRKCKTFPVYPG